MFGIRSARRPASSAARRSSLAARRGTGLALLCLLVVGQMSALLHEALVRHEICREHGELVELDAGACATEPAEHTGASREHASLPALQRAPSVSEEGHEHCFALAVSRENLLSFGTRAPDALAAPRAQRVHAVDPSQAWTDFPRFLLAPHHSPPA